MTRVNLWIIVIVLVSCTVLVLAQSNAETRCFKFTWLGPQYNKDSVFLNATCQDATRLASGVPCQQPLVASHSGQEQILGSSLGPLTSQAGSKEANPVFNRKRKKRHSVSRPHGHFYTSKSTSASQEETTAEKKRRKKLSIDGSWPDVEYIWTHHASEASCVLSATDVCAQYTYYFDGIAINSTYLCTRAIDQQGHSISSGCFQSNNGSSSVRVCFCRSIPGGVPCNGSNLTVASFTIVLALYSITNTRFLNWCFSSILQ